MSGNTMNEFVNEGNMLGQIPVFITMWNPILKVPSTIVWEEGWDFLDNEQRQEILIAVDETLEEMQEHILPDYPPEDLQG
tara:strand:+ start:716 stop:955 length:240 start_codon:yes stop_codon:yes gene_type:complete